MTSAGARTATVTPDAGVTDRYAAASGDRNPIHIDDDAARAAGLPGRIVHGYWTMAQVVRVALENAGGDPRRLRRLEIRLRGVVMPGLPLTLTVCDDGHRGRVAVSRIDVEQEGRSVISGARVDINAEEAP